MTKKQAVHNFRQDLLPGIVEAEATRPPASKDWPKRRYVWSVYTDTLQKSGQITESQYDRWQTPRFLSGEK
jgi:hypothetical protein